ncbi:MULTISPECIES: alpha/beta hydrolase [unclassified Bradyrhizobium]|uniref:alpha/beta fold hydrolase n=1 Tax=unclassified Bradyrhizobium TaxID=2631580 RepID=UPI0028F02688|nr:MULTISPECIES: alpha/beta hydrolase [unclassified Bradyrhizobium]
MTLPTTIAIVLLPGMDGTGELLKPLAERLSAHRFTQTIAYPLDRCLHYDELTAFVSRRLPKDRFVILGESFSGPIAIEIAATHPRVAGLILASSFARHPLPTWLSRFTSLLDPRWLPSKLVAAAIMGPAAMTSLGLHLREVLRSLPPAILQARAKDALRVDKRDRLAETTCPALCVHGSSDWLVGRRQIAEILRHDPTVSDASWTHRTCCWQPMPRPRRR